MHVIALTGGIGAGKSTAAEVFRSRGAVVLSLDDVAKRLLEPGSAVFDDVVSAFGEGILDARGRVDTKALARDAFSCPDRSARLNEIVHPAVLRSVSEMLEGLERRPDPPRLVVIEIPLLVESPEFQRLVGGIVTISAPEEQRVARAVASGRDEDDVRARMACQATDARREAIADVVFVNDGSIEKFREALGRYADEVIADAP
ncbi:MAG: dephospho-CoA kinase [Coriobacteriia bacterium]|nr:dephospho-CoA kinase [Coriobacteriia bacterium]